MKFLSFLVAIMIICPLVALVITYIICRKLHVSNAKAFGFAADVVTFLLFFSVPTSVVSIWGVSIVNPLIMIAIFIAITFTYIDWRTKKEIVVAQLLKKIWRVYFILLSVSYFFIFIAGLTLNILEYVKM